MAKDMTEGRLLPIIIKFTIPMVAGNLLQLTYNAVDGIIVGQYVGDAALAAVGTSNPLMTLMILFLQGICMGAGVLIGAQYGAKDYETLQKQVSTTMIAGCIFSLILTVLSLIFTPALLRLIQLDESLMSETLKYLRIILTGLLFTFVYNFFAGTLRALGDSKTPLYFLGISAVLNIAGDLVFVLAFSMGTIGCAISTVLCEALSCLFCWLYIKKKTPILNLGRKWFLFDRGLFHQTLQYGFVSAMQQSTVQMGKLGIQAIVNHMGANSTAAFHALNSLDDYAIIPGRNISNAMTSVMAQNRGAGKMERVQKTFRLGMWIEIIYGALAGCLLYWFARPLLSLFTDTVEIIEIGTRYLHLIAFMYVMPGLTNGLQGYFRGMGDLKVTLWSSMINMSARVFSCVLFVFIGKMGILALPWSYFVGWIAMLVYEVPYLIKSKLSKNLEK